MLHRTLGLLLLGAASTASAADFPPLWVAGDTKADGARLVLGRPGHVTPLAFSADNKIVAGVSGVVQPDPLVIPVQLWDADTGKHLRTLAWRHNGEQHDGLWAAAFSPDGSTLAATGYTHLRFFDVKTGKDITKEEIRLAGHHGYVVRFSPDGKRVLVGDQKLELFDVATQKRLGGKNGFYLTGGKDEGFWAVAYSPKGKYVAAGNSGTQTVQVWEAESGKLVCEPCKGYVFNETRIGFPDEKTLFVTDARKGEITTYEADTGKKLRTAKAQLSLNRTEAAPGGSCLSWPDYSYSFTRNRSNYTAVTVVTPDGKLRQHVEAPIGVYFHILSPDGSRLAVANQYGALATYSVETDKPLATMLGSWSPIVRAMYADGGKTIRVLQKDWLVRDFDAATGKQLREAELPVGEGGPRVVAFGADGKYLATVVHNGPITIWNLAENKAQTTLKTLPFAFVDHWTEKRGAVPPGTVPPPGPPPFQRQSDPRCFAAFSPDGKLFAAVTGEDNAVTIWDSATGAEKAAVKVPKDTGWLALSTDGASLFVASPRVTFAATLDGKLTDPVVRQFDLKTGKELKSWKLPRPEKAAEGTRPGSEEYTPHPLAGGTTLLVTETQSGWAGFAARAHVLDLTGKNADRVLALDSGWLAVAPDGNTLGYVTNVPKKEPQSQYVTVARTLDLTTGKTAEVALAKGWRGHTGALAFRPDGKELLVTVSDTYLLVVEAKK